MELDAGAAHARSLVGSGVGLFSAGKRKDWVGSGTDLWLAKAGGEMQRFHYCIIAMNCFVNLAIADRSIAPQGTRAAIVDQD
jgi:hypothetical protein